jgi:hypothetical protein
MSPNTRNAISIITTGALLGLGINKLTGRRLEGRDAAVAGTVGTIVLFDQMHMRGQASGNEKLEAVGWLPYRPGEIVEGLFRRG